MKDEKILFFDTKPYDRQFFGEANREYGFQLKYLNNRLNEDTADLARGYRIISIFVNDMVSEAVADKLSELGVKLVALRSAGYNNVDLDAVYDRIHVVRVPEYSPYAIAEHAVALMMTLNRKIHRAYFRVRDNNFAINGLMGFDMHGKTAGVIGTGRIGKTLLEILKGFGMNLLAYDPKPDEEEASGMGFKYVDLETLYAKSDIISLHCPLTRETEYIINQESIGAMKDGVMIINTGRGKLIDTKALIENLKTGKIAYAGLDVYEEESEFFYEDLSSSFISDDVLARLMTFHNVVITSHQGFFTKEALANIAETTLSNVREFIEGGYLKNEICYRCDRDKCVKAEGEKCF
ncbi:MAG: 2-hydroxyacid dehydrogenase [Candidatus Omnitrophica bacterium]|nr:2-hydroxyacid dehydrogenase [Candidatus Omnitrophota bacterium]